MEVNFFAPIELTRAALPLLAAGTAPCIVNVGSISGIRWTGVPYIANFAEVEVDKNSGAVRVQRVVCAQEMGLVINPAGATIQMEGCITMGLGYALSEEVRFKDGEVLVADNGSEDGSQDAAQAAVI